jgi:hypothetical protein
MFLFLFSYVSAVRVDYAPNEKGVKDMQAVIKDTILWDLIAVGERGTMELKSHKTPTEIIEVGTGWQVTMIYDTNFGQAHKDILGNVYFYDLKTGEEVERDYKFVYWGEEERTREVCNEYQNVTNSTYKNSTSYTDCVNYVNESYTYEGWLDYNSKDLPKGQIRLGLMTNVLYKDKIDGVWEVQGKKIDKHAGWTSELSVGLVSYYKLDETSGVVVDSLGINNGTNNGATRGVTGKINTAYDFDGSNDRIDIARVAALEPQYVTLNAWVYLDGTNTNAMVIDKDGTYNLWVNTNNIYTSVWAGGNWRTYLSSTNPVTTGNWHMLTMTYNGASVMAYIDGLYLGKTDYSGVIAQTGNGIFNIGHRKALGASYAFNGQIDEVGIWSRALSSTEVSELYNSGSGITYGECLTITLLSPENYYNSTNSTIDFSANLIDEEELGIQNVSLVINDTIYDTNISGLTGVYNFSETLNDGFYEWYIEAYDDTDEYYTSETRYFTIDTTPFIEFVSPTPENASNLSVPYIPVNVSVTEDYFENVTFYFYKGGVLNETITFTDDTRFYNKTGCTCANWEINATVCATTGKCNSTETRLLIIDILAPEISITSPVTSYDYLEPNQTIDLNVTVTDASEHLDTCWYSYNFTNVTFNCSENQTFNYIQDVNTITVYANDTFGNENSESVSWDYKILETNQTYNNETIIGSSEDFELNIKIGDGYSLTSAKFIYLDQEVTASIFGSGNERKIQANNFQIPLLFNNTNASFYWELVVSGTTINIDNRTQSVSTIFLDNCSVNTYPIFNISLFDERLRTPLNGTIELNYYILNKFDFSLMSNLSFSANNTQNTRVCSNINLTEEGIYYSSEIRYYAPNYATEFYHIQRALLTEEKILNLYDLHENESTMFKITYQDSTYTFVEDAIIQLKRKYISDDIYEVVEAPLTSSEGTAIVHIDLDTNKYDVIIVKNGVVLDTFENLAFVCDSLFTGECNQKLLGKIDPINDINIDTKRDFTYTDPEVINDTIKVTYSIPSSSPSLVELILIQQDQFGNSTLCNKSITSSAGSLECNFSKTIGESYIELAIRKDGELISKQSYIMPEEDKMDFLGNNYIIVMLLLLSIIGMAFTSPEWIILNGVITFFIAGSLWLLSGLNFVMGIGNLIWLLLASGILIFKLAKQEDR